MLCNDAAIFDKAIHAVANSSELGPSAKDVTIRRLHAVRASFCAGRTGCHGCSLSHACTALVRQVTRRPARHPHVRG